MSFIEAIKSCFSKYATFSGRARRSEHWYFFLFITLIQIVMGCWLMSSMFGPLLEAASTGSQPTTEEMVKLMLTNVSKPMLICYLLFTLGTLLPIIAVQVRRMHDTGRSGWWCMTYWGGQLLSIVPLASLVGAVWYIYLACQDSQPGANQYGPNPKGIDAFNPTSF